MFFRRSRPKNQGRVLIGRLGSRVRQRIHPLGAAQGRWRSNGAAWTQPGAGVRPGLGTPRARPPLSRRERPLLAARHAWRFRRSRAE